MRVAVPLLAGSILLALVGGTATAIAASSEAGPVVTQSVVAEDAAPVAVDVAPVEVVTVATEDAQPELARAEVTTDAPPVQSSAPAPTVEPGPVEDVPHQDGGEIWIDPEYASRLCTDVVPEHVTADYQSDRGFARYGVVAPVDWYWPWEGYPDDDRRVMVEHWLTSCTWSDASGILHVDFGAGLDDADVAMLQQRVSSPEWSSVMLSTGDVLFVDAAEAGTQFPETQAWLLQGDRWMRLMLVNDIDAVGFAETLLAADLVWP